MFEVESVPSRDNASYFLLLLSRQMFKKKTNDERTIGAKSAVTSRSTKYTQQSAPIGIYSHLLLSKGKGR